MNLTILDCTLRDGGYYNNWDFEPEVVSKYLMSVSEAGIDYVELGLRNFPKPGFLGAFAYTSEEFLNSIYLPKGPLYGVMVDAKTILEPDLSLEEAIDYLFVPAQESKISLVRVAAHFHEVDFCAPIISQLKQLGYIVGLNLMQAGGKPNEIIAAKARYASDCDGLDVLYFADSLGNMDESEVSRIVKALRTEWDGPLGIHTHDNMSKGLENTLAARNFGVTWLDSTVTGMGRGAGNTQTERLLTELGSVKKYNPKPIYELVIRYFEAMQRKYGWGANLLYFLGAKNEVHPTYIQNLLSNTHYGTDEIVGAIDYLSNLEGTASYNGAILESALRFSNTKSVITGSGEVQGLFDNKEVLIVANASSTEKYASIIEMYIRKVKPVVISINTTSHIDRGLIDYYVVSHNSKFLSESKFYKCVNKPIILPKCRFSESELKKLENITIIDHGLVVVKDTFDKSGTYTTIPFDLTAGYVLGILLESKVKNIAVVGFDGYSNDDIRQLEMLEILGRYQSHEASVELMCLTPTTYPIKKSSIYAYI